MPSHTDHGKAECKKPVTDTVTGFLSIEWCRDQDLNQGHTDFQSVALPTELSRHRSVEATLLAEVATLCQPFFHL